MSTNWSKPLFVRWRQHRPCTLGCMCWAILVAVTTALWSAEEGHHGDDGDVDLHVRHGETQAAAYDRFVEEKLKLTYPATAARMLGECGGIREGICLDLGCGSGHLDVELAQRSKFKIIGLDIDAGMKPLFEKRIHEAGLDKRVTFVQGDAQKLPFPDHYADIIVSRGMLIFVPDIPQCLREVSRVLKPTGVAFLGGRYLYAPRKYKMSAEKLRALVADSGVAGAEAIDARGQWVKILGPQSSPAAREFGLGPQMLAHRIVADYGITQGRCLLICRGDGALEQALQHGLTDVTDFQITALYASEQLAQAAQARLQQAKLDRRIACQVGGVQALPFDAGRFDVVASVGCVPFWPDREAAMREIYRVLRPGGAGLVGGMYRFMPESRKVSSEALRQEAARTGIPSIRVYDDLGQWLEIRKKSAEPGA
jgi:ubiquinone/menaquinone biosynthesis C-methylase UbiE